MTMFTLEQTSRTPAAQNTYLGYSPLQLEFKANWKRELIAQWLIVDGKLVCRWNVVLS